MKGGTQPFHAPPILTVVYPFIWIDNGFFYFTETTCVVRGAQTTKGGRKLNNSLIRILVTAKEMNKWVPINLLSKYGIQEVNLFDLEDEGLLLINQSKSNGTLLKLTLKGYHHFR